MAEWLRAAGHEAEHVENVGLRNAKDRLIWEHAIEGGAVIVTKDADFADRARANLSAPAVVWLRIGNATNPVLWAWFTPRCAGMVRLIAEGNRIVEVI
jgi:predicted nuclease of predicted toxin-antitoxin system